MGDTARVNLNGTGTQFTVTLAKLYATALRIGGVWLVSGLALGLVFGLGAGVAAAVGRGSDGVSGLRIALFMLSSVVVLLVFQALLWPYLTSRLQNLYWNGTRSEHWHFESRLAFRPLAWLTLKNWCLILITLGLYFPFARVALARMRLQAVSVMATVPVDQLINEAAAVDEGAAGDAAGDLFGIDIGL